MEIVYIEDTPFGKFYYNPSSYEGVAIPKDNLDPVVLGMKKEYDPFSDRSAVRLDVPAEAFKELRDAAEKRDGKEVEGILKKYFS